MIPDIDIDPLEADIPSAAKEALAAAQNPYTAKKEAETALKKALEIAPDNLSLQMAAYKFYYYASDMTNAAHHAGVCLTMAAEVLQLPRDWKQVTSTSVDFDTFDRAQRVYLQSLMALGYCHARLGDKALSLELLEKAASLDPKDRLGAKRLAEVISESSDAVAQQ